jgi:hypothetical protein
VSALALDLRRMGHSTARAAMVYLHGSNERQHAIADELSRQAAEQLGQSAAKPSDATGTAAPDGIVTACPILGRMMADLGVQFCAPTATRTRDLLLRRQSRIVVRRRPVRPDVPFIGSENGWTWPGAALCLWSLAPRLAPCDLVSNANVRIPDTCCGHRIVRLDTDPTRMSESGHIARLLEA